MELTDIKTINELKKQVANLGISLELIGDGIQNLKKLHLDQSTDLDEIQSLIYKASIKCSEYKEK